VWGAAFVSIVSASLSGYAVFGRTAAVTHAPDELASLRRDLNALRESCPAQGDHGPMAATLREVSARLAVVERRSGLARPPVDDDEPAPAAPPSASASATAAPRSSFVRFEVPSSAVAVTESSPGSLSVTNTDPELTGKTLVVRGHAADGTVQELTILVPAPAR
jgi:hypothetical protein